ncbi:hypothetical protein ACOSQ2_004204 [Xanthoceras sorbifolium]
MQCQASFDFILNSWNEFMTPKVESSFLSSADLDSEDCLRIGTGLLFQALGPLLEAEKKVSALEAENKALATEAKSLEAEIPAKTAQIVEDFNASNKFDEHLLKELEKEYDRGVNDCHNFICLTHPELDLKSLDNAITKMTRKEEDSKS